MGASDCPSEWDPSHDDDEALPLKHQPNSWAIQKVSTSEPPLQPRCQAFLVPPAVPWILSHNDKKLLQSLKIRPE